MNLPKNREKVRHELVFFQKINGPSGFGKNLDPMIQAGHLSYDLKMRLKSDFLVSEELLGTLGLYTDESSVGF